MDISRISKAVAVVRRDATFQGSEDVRNKDIDLLMPRKLFNWAIFNESRSLVEKWDFCLLRFSSKDQAPTIAQQSISIGKCGLLGAGGIGSAVGYVLSISNWSGQIDIIDNDIFETPNLE